MTCRYNTLDEERDLFVKEYVKFESSRHTLEYKCYLAYMSWLDYVSSGRPAYLRGNNLSWDGRLNQAEFSSELIYICRMCGSAMSNSDLQAFALTSWRRRRKKMLAMWFVCVCVLIGLCLSIFNFLRGV